MTADWTDDAERVADEALAWYVRLTSGNAIEQDFVDHADWLAADPSHLHAFDAVQEQMMRVEAAGPAARARFADELRPAAHRMARARRFSFPARWFAAPALALAAVIAIVVVVPRLRDMSQPPAQIYETADSGTRQVRLDDGTVVDLDADTRLVVAYSAGKRRTTLDHGTAFFDVVHNAEKPFTVAAAGHLVTVLGTRFEVSDRAQTLSVSVARGAVAVAQADPASGATVRHVLRQGEGITYGPGSAVPVKQSVDPDNVGAWREGRLVFDHAPLSQVVAKINRHVAQGEIKIDDPKIARRPFTGVLVVTDARTTASRLAGLMQLTYTEDGKVITLSHHQSAPHQP